MKMKRRMSPRQIRRLIWERQKWEQQQQMQQRFMLD